LAACGGGGSDSIIDISDETTGASIGSDLSLTVRVAPGDSTGFTTKVGPDGARISLDSGERIEISANRPAALQIESNDASVNIASVDGKLWSGELSSPVQASVRFRFSALDNPQHRATLTVDITP
jgi:hypothetical protein